MKNGNLTHFLDTGWYTEAVLFFDGHVYWCEEATDFETGIISFFVDSWKAECDGKNYHQYQNESGKLIDCKRVLEITGYDHDRIKQQFLTAPVFDGKTFWQVEKDLIWVEEGSSIQIKEV